MKKINDYYLFNIKDKTIALQVFPSKNETQNPNLFEFNYFILLNKNNLSENKIVELAQSTLNVKNTIFRTYKRMFPSDIDLYFVLGNYIARQNDKDFDFNVSFNAKMINILVDGYMAYWPKDEIIEGPFNYGHCSNGDLEKIISTLNKIEEKSQEEETL